ncbi:MAG: TlpA family protein disulfide reductase [Xanthomonadaceae bacterium]|nr:TlpA family protein disulfide reductase [Xanthomonadaceae bacterium]
MMVLLFAAMLSPVSRGWADENAEFDRIGGGTESLLDYRGQTVVLNVWAIWCAPCIGEIPELVELQRRIAPRNATVVGLAVDSGAESQVLSFWRRRLELEPSYPLWLGSMEQAKEHFGAITVPLTLLIDRQGTVRERLLGAHDAETLLEKLEPLL